MVERTFERSIPKRQIERKTVQPVIVRQHRSKIAAKCAYAIFTTEDMIANVCRKKIAEKYTVPKEYDHTLDA